MFTQKRCVSQAMGGARPCSGSPCCNRSSSIGGGTTITCYDQTGIYAIDTGRDSFTTVGDSDRYNCSYPCGTLPCDCKTNCWRPQTVYCPPQNPGIYPAQTSFCYPSSYQSRYINLPPPCCHAGDTCCPCGTQPTCGSKCYQMGGGANVMFGTKNPFGPQSDDEKTPENSPKGPPPKDGCLGPAMEADQPPTCGEPPPSQPPNGASRGKTNTRGGTSAAAAAGGTTRGGAAASKGRGVRSPIKSPPVSRGSAATASRGSTRGSRGNTGMQSRNPAFTPNASKPSRVPERFTAGTGHEYQPSEGGSSPGANSASYLPDPVSTSGAQKYTTDYQMGVYSRSQQGKSPGPPKNGFLANRDPTIMDYGNDGTEFQTQHDPNQPGGTQQGAFSTGGMTRAGTTPRFRGGPGSAQRGSRGATSRGGIRGSTGFRGSGISRGSAQTGRTRGGVRGSQLSRGASGLSRGGSSVQHPDSYEPEGQEGDEFGEVFEETADQNASGMNTFTQSSRGGSRGVRGSSYNSGITRGSSFGSRGRGSGLSGSRSDSGMSSSRGGFGLSGNHRGSAMSGSRGASGIGRGSAGSTMSRGGGSGMQGSGSLGQGHMVSEVQSQGSVISSDPAADPYQELESDEEFEEEGDLHQEAWEENDQAGQGMSMLGSTAGKQPSKSDPRISGISGSSYEFKGSSNVNAYPETPSGMRGSRGSKQPMSQQRSMATSQPQNGNQTGNQNGIAPYEEDPRAYSHKPNFSENHQQSGSQDRSGSRGTSGNGSGFGQTPMQNLSDAPSQSGGGAPGRTENLTSPSVPTISTSAASSSTNSAIPGNQSQIHNQTSFETSNSRVSTRGTSRAGSRGVSGSSFGRGSSGFGSRGSASHQSSRGFNSRGGGGVGMSSVSASSSKPPMSVGRRTSGGQSTAVQSRSASMQKSTPTGASKTTGASKRSSSSSSSSAKPFK